MEKEVRTIRMPLTKEEINQKARQLAVTLSEKSELVEAKKAAVAGYKVQIDEKDKIIRNLSEEITLGSVVEDVECLVLKHFETGEKQFIYQDEIVDTEPLSAEDRQLSLTQ